MTKSKAIARAIKLAQRSGYDYLIVTEPDWQNNFQSIREDHWESYFHGCKIIACADPTGHIHY